MKISACVCILSGWLTPGFLAAQGAAKISPPPVAKQTRKTPPAPAIPKDAVQTTPGFYRWTDKDGKAWTYRQTPFGVKRWPADAVDSRHGVGDTKLDGGGAPAAGAGPVAERTTAVEAGDSIRFEKATPFGKRTWLRKKTELNETEQGIWEQQRKNTTASRTTEKE